MNDLPLSYAQNLEDYHLSLAFAGQPTGTYIDIGGGHPVAGSVSFWFYERGWQGIVVEPQERARSAAPAGAAARHGGEQPHRPRKAEAPSCSSSSGCTR